MSHGFSMKLTDRPATYRLLSIAWMALIFCLSSRSHLPGPDLFSGQDKIAHVLAFGILGFLLIRAFPRGAPQRLFLRSLLVVLAVAVYGGLDEFHQMFVPGREASLWDLAADVAGGILAVTLFRNGRTKSGRASKFFDIRNQF